MIQLNLLPDVKMEYIKAERLRSMVMTASVLVTAASIAILVIMLLVDLAQHKHLSDLTKDINNESSQLKSKPQISKILTVQNQLESLTGLHSSKPAASNLFDYLNEVTPADVSISSYTTDFGQHTATISGTADSLATVNKYVDTLKFTTYTTDKNSTSTKAFSDVVLGSFSISGNSGAQSASYSISFSYDSNIFDITQKVKLSVPSQVTTRSTLAQPTDLFQTKGGQ